jgi:hypothetical protein
MSNSFRFQKEITKILSDLNLEFSTLSESRIVLEEFEVSFSPASFTNNKRTFFFLDLSDPSLEISTQKLFEEFFFLENIYFYRNFTELSLIFKQVVLQAVSTDIVGELNNKLVNFDWIKLFQENQHDALLLHEEFQSIFNISNAKIQDFREISLDLENSKFYYDLFNSKN